MNMNSPIAKEIFEGKYPEEMSYESYLILLEEGFEILKENNDSFSNYTELHDLKAIRIALEYRMELLRQYRKKQLRSVGHPVSC
jgi:hypothetical protein